MGDRNGASARRKSRRLAKANAQGNYDLSPSTEFSTLPENQILPLQDDDSSSNITPPPPVKRKAQTKAPKKASKKAAKKAAKKAVAETVTSSDDTLSSDSDGSIVPHRRRGRKTRAES
ncbi:hypothetical protein DFH08DRAFT_821494 [Mycena albidolilacea]|uniref:Uncharacterized protein n=1 Tax=Mycena albidolilacea TaxID=1033008 RepID=A0AAD6ZB53_9AGAR|nr:hypothetical protein DFH08DRAFT_821494 [Mycena albidolilacea]